MAREIRFVPANWQHPKNEQGKYIPLLNNRYSGSLEHYHKAKNLWNEGFILDINDSKTSKSDNHQTMEFEDWYGQMPFPGNYMPLFINQPLTHIQLYENTSEGTPISPLFKKSDFPQLCEWASYNIPIFADKFGSIDEWKKLLTRNNSSISIDGLEFL